MPECSTVTLLQSPRHPSGAAAKRARGFEKFLITSKTSDAGRRGATTGVWSNTPQMMPWWWIRA